MKDLWKGIKLVVFGGIKVYFTMLVALVWFVFLASAVLCSAGMCIFDGIRDLCNWVIHNKKPSHLFSMTKVIVDLWKRALTKYGGLIAEICG